MITYVLGIDPGTRARNPAGGALLAFEDGDERLIETWEWRPVSHAIHRRIWEVAHGLSLAVGAYHADAWDAFVLAYEDAYLGENPQSFKALANMGGAVIGLAASLGLDAQPVQPSQGKLALTRHGDADAAMMRRAAQQRFGLAAEPSGHIAHAIGVALHVEAELRRERLARAGAGR